MDIYSQVEKKYGFTFPPSYRSFIDRGYLTHSGDKYLSVHEAEWLPPNQMLENGGFWGKPKAGLVAFAFTGGRDLWAWQTQRVADLGEPAIVHCPRDSFEGWWHAPSFLGWLYRMSLEYAWMMWDDEAESKINLRRWAAVLREFEKPLWADDVESIATREAAFREPTHAKHGSASLLSHAEVNDRIFAAGPGFIDAPYVWDVDGESNEAS